VEQSGSHLNSGLSLGIFDEERNMLIKGNSQEGTLQMLGVGLNEFNYRKICHGAIVMEAFKERLQELGKVCFCFF
jgi:hypothetical protein